MHPNNETTIQEDQSDQIPQEIHDANETETETTVQEDPSHKDITESTVNNQTEEAPTAIEVPSDPLPQNFSEAI